MLNRFRLAAMSAAAIIGATLVAYGAGLFPDYPIVGSAAFCAGTSTGVSSQVCVATVPAGPTIVTGNELIPADTNLAGGAQPQTVRIPMNSLNALPITVQTFLTGATFTSPNQIGGLVVHAAGTLATFTLVMPTSPINGQQFRLCSDQTLTSLTVTPAAGQTMGTPNPTALTPAATAGNCYLWMWNTAAATWYRLN
jgi:hypothetical protein